LKKRYTTKHIYNYIFLYNYIYIYKHKWKDVLLHIIYVDIKLLHTIINININFIYKINFKNKTLYPGCPIFNNLNKNLYL